MSKTVLVRAKQLHGNISKMLRCEVLSEADGKIRCRCEGEKKERTVDASAVLDPKQIYATATPQAGALPVIQGQPTGLHTLANMLK
jgi:hypothetical protein